MESAILTITTDLARSIQQVKGRPIHFRVLRANFNKVREIQLSERLRPYNQAM